MKHKNLGFTLIELLVVIAIIGILSAVAIVNLNSAREKARQSNVLNALSQLTPAVIVCFDDEKDLTTNGTALCNSGGVPQVGAKICPTSSATWPDLVPQGWYYIACSSSYNANPASWQIWACSKAGCAVPTKYVVCNNTSCTAGNF